MDINQEITHQSFLGSVEEILKSILEISEFKKELTMDTSLVYGVNQDGLDLSSIDFVELIVAVEDRYNITFDFDVTIKTLQDLYDYIIKGKDDHAKREQL